MNHKLCAAASGQAPNRTTNRNIMKKNMFVLALGALLLNPVAGQSDPAGSFTLVKPMKQFGYSGNLVAGLRQNGRRLLEGGLLARLDFMLGRCSWR
jgi:hypothetical protein